MRLSIQPIVPSHSRISPDVSGRRLPAVGRARHTTKGTCTSSPLSTSSPSPQVCPSPFPEPLCHQAQSSPPDIEGIFRAIRAWSVIPRQGCSVLNCHLRAGHASRCVILASLAVFCAEGDGGAVLIGRAAMTTWAIITSLRSGKERGHVLSTYASPAAPCRLSSQQFRPSQH